MFSSKSFFINRFTTKFLIRAFSSHSCKTHYKMNVVYFRCTSNPNQKQQEQQKQLQINFHYTNHLIDRDFNFCRNLNENIDVFLDRLKNNIEKELTKKFKKKKSKKSANNDSASGEEKGDGEQLPLPDVSMHMLYCICIYIDKKKKTHIQTFYSSRSV